MSYCNHLDEQAVSFLLRMIHAGLYLYLILFLRWL